MVDFRQSYVVRPDPHADEDIDVLAYEINRIDSMKTQISKFRNDLEGLNNKGSPVIAKTLSNMTLLEEDISSLVKWS